MKTLFLGLCALLALTRPAAAMDVYAEPDVGAYFATLMQPDHPTSSCCGFADAYEADRAEPCRLTDGDECALVAIITDTRPDARTLPDGRRIVRTHLDVGTRVPITKSKVRKHPSANPTDHGIVFVSIGEYGNYAICYEPTTGG